MDFFEDMGKKIGKFAKKVGDKSGEIVETGKINVEIHRQQEQIKRYYKEMGEAVYKAYKEQKDCGEMLSDYCKKIDECNDKIAELKQKLEENKTSTKQEDDQTYSYSYTTTDNSAAQSSNVQSGATESTSSQPPVNNQNKDNNVIPKEVK